MPFQGGVPLPERVVVFVQRVDAQSRLGQGGDHLAQAVDELDRPGVLDGRLRVGITAGVGLVPDLWPLGKVVVGDRAAFLVVEGVGEGVEFREVQEPARTQKRRDDLGPAVEV